MRRDDSSIDSLERELLGEPEVFHHHNGGGHLLHHGSGHLHNGHLHNGHLHNGHLHHGHHGHHSHAIHLRRDKMSVTNLSRDSGLTLSDTQLYTPDEDMGSESSSSGKSIQFLWPHQSIIIIIIIIIIQSLVPFLFLLKSLLTRRVPFFFFVQKTNHQLGFMEPI